MKIKSAADCYTLVPDMKWIAGEVQEVADSIGEKLLNNNNFTKEVSQVYKTREMKASKS